MTTQKTNKEPMEWESEFEKIFLNGNKIKDQFQGVIVADKVLIEFISSQIKQAEERGYEKARAENCGTALKAFENGRKEERNHIVKEIDRCIPKFDFDNLTHDKENKIAYYTHNKVLDEIKEIINLINQNNEKTNKL